jgi:SP family sugar:H+ symporter-like MFS transporter
MEEIEGFFRNGVPARQWSRQPKLHGANSGSLEDVVEEKGEAKGWEDTARV